MAFNYKYNNNAMQLEDADGYAQTELTKLRTGPYVAPSGLDTPAVTALISGTTSLVNGKVRDGGGTTLSLVRSLTASAQGSLDVSSTTTTSYITTRSGASGGNPDQGLSLETQGNGWIRLMCGGNVDLCGQSSNYLRVNGNSNGNAPAVNAVGGADADVDIKLVPKGLGNVITNWGYTRLYTGSYQSISALTTTKVVLNAAAINTFVTGACSTLSDQFTNTSGRTGNYLVTYSIGCVAPTAYMQLQSWISQTGTAHIIGQSTTTAGGSSGTNGMTCAGSAVVRLANNESVWINTYAGTACQISYITTASWACTQVTVTQVG